KVFDRILHSWDHSRIAADATAPGVSEQVDLARRSGRIPDFFAQSAMEHSLSLAVFGTDAQHPHGRPGCSTASRTILFSTNIAFESADCAHLDWRLNRILCLAAAQAVSHAGLELSRLLCGVFCSAWKELLSGADLSHAVGSRRGSDRVGSHQATRGVAQACNSRCLAGKWDLFGARSCAGIVPRQIYFLYALPPLQTAGHGALARSSEAAAVVCRPVWLE